MTNAEAAKISLYKQKGWGYKRIAIELGLSQNTVKSYIKRNETSIGSICEECGKVLHLVPGKKKKRFCSDACRMAWWKAHQDQVQHQKVYEHNCRHCGASFRSLRKDSLFCSRTCFAGYRKEASSK